MTILSDELANDPLGRGYAGMTDEQAAASLNTVNRTRNRAEMTGSEIINAANKAEFTALTDAAKATFWNIVHLGTINPFGVEASLMIDLFGGGSATITALASLRVEDISRATELGLPEVRPADVAKARALNG